MPGHLDDDQAQEHRHTSGCIAEMLGIYRKAVLAEGFTSEMADQLTLMWARNCVVNPQLLQVHTDFTLALRTLTDRLGE